MKAIKEYEAMYLRMVNEIAVKHKVSTYDVIFGAHEYSHTFCYTEWVKEYHQKIKLLNGEMANRFALSFHDVAKLHINAVYNARAKFRRKIIRQINYLFALCQ